MNLEDLIARQEIWNCLLRYTRGVDRLDRELLLSAYHPDAIDDHGVFVGPVTKFADWVLDFHEQNQFMTQHSMTNHQCEIDGDVAHSETYVNYHALNRDGTQTLGVGRYADRLERRDGKWAIAARLSITQAMHVLEAGEVDQAAIDSMAASSARRNRGDPTYQRPLILTASGPPT